MRNTFCSQQPFRLLPVILCCICFVICVGCDPAGSENTLNEMVAHQASFSEEPLNHEKESSALVSRSNSEPISGRYIVKFKEDAFVEGNEQAREAKNIDRSLFTLEFAETEAINIAHKEKVVSAFGEYKIPSSSIKEVIASNHIQGMVVELDKKMLANLKNDERVETIEQDQLFTMSLIHPSIRSPMIPSTILLKLKQVSTYGTGKVGGAVNKSNSSTWIWIVDTGVDINHNDLNVVKSYSRNFVSNSNNSNSNNSNRFGDDGHGHGTHVAGIAGAKNNNRGIVGVAAGAPLVSVKVISDQGTGTVSDLLRGLAWIERHGISGDVVNISLGGDVSFLIDNAVKKLANKGIKVVIAAGNDAQPINNVSPARLNYTNVYTISSINNIDNYCSFSNYGSGIDFAAPGEDILSTFPDNHYAYLTGTSMAAPHAAGVLLVTSNPSSNGRAKNNPHYSIGELIISH